MAGKFGVDNTKKSLIGLVALGAFVAQRLKDGAQMEDAKALGEKLAMDAEFRKLVDDGRLAITHVVEECTELDLEDGLKLASAVPQLLEAAKKYGA